MKKYFVILAAAVAAVACSKGEDYDVTVGGRNTYSLSEGASYMMFIADNLVTDALDEIELALNLNDAIMAAGQSTRYLITGPQDLEEAGSTWKVISNASNVVGMEIVSQGNAQWKFTYAGEYAFGLANAYPTTFVMLVERGDLKSEGHYNWTVTLSGSREEKNSYRCQFESLGPVAYQIEGQTLGWNYLVGKYSMKVFKGEEAIDLCLLSFNGSISKAQFVRGL